MVHRHPAPRPRQRVAVVLGGGGMKGFAHIGVLRALAERGIAPTLYAGTSIGALIAAAAVGGMSIEEMAGRAVALFRTRKGGVFAVDNRCPHKGGPLAEGMLAGDAVVCPLHAFRFDLRSGDCDQPGACPVAAHQTEVRGGDVYLTLQGA